MAPLGDHEVAPLSDLVMAPYGRSLTGSMHFIPAGSQVLQRRDGYRQLFRLYSLLHLATQCDFDDHDFRNLLETKDTPTLFEYWSFFVVKDILDENRKILSCQPVVSNEPLEQKVHYEIRIGYEGGVSIWFNHTYQGSSGCQPCVAVDERYSFLQSYSHNLRPDIVVEKMGKFLSLMRNIKGRGGAYMEKRLTAQSNPVKGKISTRCILTGRRSGMSWGPLFCIRGKSRIFYPAHGKTELLMKA